MTNVGIHSCNSSGMLSLGTRRAKLSKANARVIVEYTGISVLRRHVPQELQRYRVLTRR